MTPLTERCARCGLPVSECWRVGRWTSTGGWRYTDGSPFPPSVWDDDHPNGTVIETCEGYTEPGFVCGSIEVAMEKKERDPSP